MSIKTAPFESAKFLDSEEAVSEYINAALEEDDPDVFLMALANVIKARGVAKIAAEAGLGRESLYKTLAPGARPRYDTVLKLTRAVGVKLTMTPAHP